MSEVVDTLRRPGRSVAGDGAGTPTISLPAPTGPAGHSGVMIEIVFLRVDGTGRWHFRCVAEQLPTRTDPERAARRLTGLDDGCEAADESVLHSTSWRYDPAGHVVLTYALLPDRDPAAAKPLPGLEIARGGHHARPAPTAIGPENVAAHAIRHLAWLASTDPVVAAAFGENETLLRALADVCPDPAGQLS